MKSGLATSLSIAGVLLAGGSALALNSSVLQDSSTVRGAPALAATVSADALNAANGGITALGAADAATAPAVEANGVVDVITDPTTTTVADAPGTPVAPTTSVATPAPAPAPSIPTSTVARPPATVEKAFQVEDIAVITLSLNGRTLTVKSVVVTPGSPYKVTNTYTRDGDDVRITLASPARTIEFSARLINGQIVAAVNNPVSGNLPPRPPHDDEDDDDDEEEHNERPAPPRRTEDRNHEERENDDD
ncbi:MAG: hypothetical protein NTZ76_03040 [Actinobacteria bacterium]|nr:hypothetical protein [Actinomycetota bacterium]